MMWSVMIKAMEVYYRKKYLVHYPVQNEHVHYEQDIFTQTYRKEKIVNEITNEGRTTMTEEEKKEVLMKLGLTEEQAEWYLQYDNDIWAVVPTFRLLKPLNDSLTFYETRGM